MVVEFAHAARLLAESDDRGLEIVVGYPYHYNQQVLAARDWIASGEIGELLYAHSLFASIVWELFRGNIHLVADAVGFTITPTGTDTYGDPAVSGGGQAIVQVTHSAALLLFMTGLVPVDVFAFMENRDLRRRPRRRHGGAVRGRLHRDDRLHRFDGARPGGAPRVPALRNRGPYPARLGRVGPAPVPGRRLHRAQPGRPGRLERGPTPSPTRRTRRSTTWSTSSWAGTRINSPPQLGAAVVGLLEAAYESARTGIRQAVPS